MTNALLAFPNKCAASVGVTPTIVGGYGSFQITADNILNNNLSKFARTTDATTDSTKFRVDLGAPGSIRVVAMPKSNVSFSGRIRVTGYSDAGFSVEVFTSSWVDYWSDLYSWGTRPWGSPGLLSPKANIPGYPAVWWYVLPSTLVARYIQVEFDDTSNVDGYLDLHRLFVGPAWQATINPSYGSEIRWESRSTVRRSRTGRRIVDLKTASRSTTLNFEYLPLSEGFDQPFEMGRQLDLAGEVFFIMDPSDTALGLKRAFMASITRSLPSLNYSNVNAVSTTVELEERL